MANMRTAVVLSFLIGVAAAASDGQVTDKFGNPCLPQDEQRTKGLPVGAQLAIGAAIAAGAAIGGGVAEAEANPKLVNATVGALKDATSGVVKAFTNSKLKEAAERAIEKTSEGFENKALDKAFSKSKMKEVFSEDGFKKVITAMNKTLGHLLPPLNQVTGIIHWHTDLRAGVAADDLVKNIEFKIAVEQGIAIKLLIPQLWVTASLEVERTSLRRLAAATHIKINFDIAVPDAPGAPEDQSVESIRERLATITAKAWDGLAQNWFGEFLFTSTTPPSTTVAPFDSSSGSTGGSSASLDSAASLQSQSLDSSGSAASLGSDASGSSGFYMSISMWLVLVAALCCGVAAVGFVFSMKKGKKRSSKGGRSLQRQAGEQDEEELRTRSVPAGAEVAPEVSLSFMAPPQGLIPLQLQALMPSAFASGPVYAPAQAMTTQQYLAPVAPGFERAAAPAIAGPYRQVSNGRAGSPGPARGQFPAGTATPPTAAGTYAALATDSANVSRMVTPSPTPPAPQMPGVIARMLPANYAAVPVLAEINQGPMIPAVVAAQPPRAVTEALFNQIDRNQDGVITRKELRQAVRNNVVKQGPGL